MSFKKRSIALALVVAIVVIAAIPTFLSARKWAAYNGERVIGHRDATGRFIVTGMSSTDGRQLLRMLSCSPEYVKHEYEKSKDINVYASYLAVSRGHISSDALQKEVDRGAVTDRTLSRLP